MTASFVGTPALAAAASSNSMSVTGVWGAGQNRTAPHLLVAVISAFGPTSVTLGTPPAGWALYQTEPSGATLTTVTYTKIATGGDSAPVFTATTVGGAGSSALTCTLFECADSGGLTPVIQASGVQMDTSSQTLSPSAPGLGSGDVAIAFAALADSGSNATATWTTPAGGWTSVATQTSSLPSQIGIFQFTTPASGSLSVTLSWTRASQAQCTAQLLAIASPQQFTGAATATIALSTSATGAKAIKQAAAASAIMLSAAAGSLKATRKSSASSTVALTAVAVSPIASRQSSASATITLSSSGVGVVINSGYIQTFVFFYTGTTLQFEIDEVNPNSVLFSFLSVGFIVTLMTPTKPAFSDGTGIEYVFCLQRYALPPVQPFLTDPNQIHN